MSKVLEDSLGNLEYLLLGLTFLGVLYLVVKQAGIKFNMSQNTVNTRDGMSPHLLRYETVSDSQTHRGWNN